jgi:hypothetical protein
MGDSGSLPAAAAAVESAEAGGPGTEACGSGGTTVRVGPGWAELVVGEVSATEALAEPGLVGVVGDLS